MAKRRRGKSVRLAFRVEPELREWLDGWADRTERTLTQLVVKVLERAKREGWTFGTSVTPDAARKVGGA